jgi:putative thioredoxin
MVGLEALMSASDFIVDVNETDFEYEVLAYSQNTPVVVDFWATWCKPCKVISPLLEKLANEAQGSFRLARLDVDENQNLALRYGVRSIPTQKAISQGEVVGELVGAQPEARLREFINKLLPPSPASLAAEKANSLLRDHEWKTAEQAFRDILDQYPDQVDCLLGLAKALLAQGTSYEAQQILDTFPASRLFSEAESLLPLAAVYEQLQQNTLALDSDLDATFANSIRLAKRGNFPAAIDGLLEILRQNKRYRDGLARQIILALLSLMGEDDPQTRSYRSELTSVLF